MVTHIRVSEAWWHIYVSVSYGDTYMRLWTRQTLLWLPCLNACTCLISYTNHTGYPEPTPGAYFTNMVYLQSQHNMEISTSMSGNAITYPILKLQRLHRCSLRLDISHFIPHCTVNVITYLSIVLSHSRRWKQQSSCSGSILYELGALESSFLVSNASLTVDPKPKAHNSQIHHITKFGVHFICDHKQKLQDDDIKWKYFPRYWAFVQGIQRSPGNSLH